MLSKEEIEKAIDQNEDIITYKADKDFRGLTSSERTLLENNKKIKEYIDQLEQENNKLNKMIDEMAKAWKQDDCRSIKEIKKHFEKKVEEK